MARTRVLIAGAAGRDFHNFNLVYRGRPEYDVVAFTATQIPNIDGRVYPAALAGSLYPDGIPILPESALEQLIREHEIDEVVFAYSDVTHEHVMHLGSRALAAGASYRLISPRETMLASATPTVAICAVRTAAVLPVALLDARGRGPRAARGHRLARDEASLLCSRAPVAQWIEQRFPKPRAAVRSGPGASTSLCRMWCACRNFRGHARTHVIRLKTLKTA